MSDSPIEELMGPEGSKRVKRLQALSETALKRADYILSRIRAERESDDIEIFEADDEPVESDQLKKPSLTPAQISHPASATGHSLIIPDISYGVETLPVRLVNDLDSSAPEPFVYSSELVDRTRKMVLDEVRLQPSSSNACL